LGEQLSQDLTVREFCIAGDLDFFRSPLPCGIELFDLNSENGPDKKHPPGHKQEQENAIMRRC
jgi:hypothetical protein